MVALPDAQALVDQCLHGQVGKARGVDDLACEPVEIAPQILPGSAAGECVRREALREVIDGLTAGVADGEKW